MGKLGLTKMTCVVSVFCVATAIASHAQAFTTLHSFAGSPTEGSYPQAGLIQATDGNFYGTTYGGGTNNDGTVFLITPTGTLTTLYSFCSQANCADGENPYAGPIQATDGNFYGTSGGGANGRGTVFQITPTGTLTTLYSFCSLANCADGEYPYAGLIQATDGNFYGTTYEGGTSGAGTVFEITPTGALTTLYSFCSLANCADGQLTRAGLIQATDGNFYGTTFEGGANSYGIVFEITPTGTLTTLYSFCSQANCLDGKLPFAGVIQSSDGNFYGTTNQGGAIDDGIVFEITPTGTLTTLYSFCSKKNCTDGAYPGAGLIQATDGNFYGTSGGGAHNYGTVFEITPTGTLTTLYAFCSKAKCSDGQYPTGPLIQSTNGNFYGMTGGGGANSFGTVYTFGPPTVTLLPTSLTWGTQVLDQASAAKSLRVKNSGTAVLTISAVTIAGNFAISSNTCAGAALTMNQTCTVSVTFTPTVLGLQTGTLSITDNAANSPQTVPLSGTGVAPATLTPTSATYAAQAVGTSSAAKTFTLTNNQTGTLTGIAISTTGDFAVSATTCTTSLAAKGKCTISVVFKPTATGTRTGMLTVSDSASNSPQTANLTGTGK